MLCVLVLALVLAAAGAAGSPHAHATLVYNDEPGYVAGASVLAQSLRETATPSDLVAVVTPLVGARARRELRAAGWALREVDPVVDPQMPVGHMWHYVMTKLEMWRLPYARVLYLDADTLVAGNATLEHLFACGDFCAVADPFPTDTFNSGVMVLTPSDATYAALRARIATMPPHSFADQALLNAHFGYRALPLAQRLPAAYNVEAPQYADHRQSFALVRVIHYTTPNKPWRWWTAAFLVTGAPWRAARHRLGAHCRGKLAERANRRSEGPSGSSGCEAAARGNVDAPLALFCIFALLAAVLVAPPHWLAPPAATVAVIVYALVASTWHVAAAAVLVLFVSARGNENVASHGLRNEYVAGRALRKPWLATLRILTIAAAALVAVAVLANALPEDANAVASHAAAFALTAAIMLACAAPLACLAIPPFFYAVTYAVARGLEASGHGDAGLIASNVLVALAVAAAFLQGIVAWCGLAWRSVL